MSNPDNVIVVDRMELADEITSMIMDDKYPNEGWMENVIPGDERSTLIVKSEHEVEYCDIYEGIEDLIRSCEVRNLLNVDWDELQKQKDYLIGLRDILSNHQLLQGVIHLLDNLQDQFEPKPEK